MADSLAVLSGSTCGCNVECGISPKWFRLKLSWTSGTLHTSIHHPHDTSTNKAGYVLQENCFNHGSQAYPTMIGTVYEGYFAGQWYIDYDCEDFNSCKYTTTTWSVPGTYLRAATTSTSVTLDMNIGLYKKDKPTETSVIVKIVFGKWAQSATNNLVQTYINSTDCAQYESMVTTMNNNWCGRWGYLIYWPETETWPSACNGYLYDGSYYGYSLGPGMAKGRAITWYGYNKNLEYGRLNGLAAGATIYSESGTYDRDPNTAGAQAFYSVAKEAFPDKVYLPTNYRSQLCTINLTTGAYTFAPA